MKTLAFFSAILAVTASEPRVETWTFNKLSDAMSLEALMPYIKSAFNGMMFTLYTGQNWEMYYALIPSPSGTVNWTFDELTNALKDEHMNEDYRDAIEQTHFVFQDAIDEGIAQASDSIPVRILAVDISTWNLLELNQALLDTSTNEKLKPYLDKARMELLQSMDEGSNKSIIGIVTPVGLIQYKTPNYDKKDYGYLPLPSRRFIKKIMKRF